MADYTREIEVLERRINAAVDNIRTGDISTSFDLDAARRRLAELRRLDDTSIAAGRVRPRVTGINLRSAW